MKRSYGDQDESSNKRRRGDGDRDVSDKRGFDGDDKDGRIHDPIGMRNKLRKLITRYAIVAMFHRSFPTRRAICHIIWVSVVAVLV